MYYFLPAIHRGQNQRFWNRRRCGGRYAIGFRGIYSPDSSGTENRKSPEGQQYQGFPGIDAKTAFQNGRLFLYQSLRFDCGAGDGT